MYIGIDVGTQSVKGVLVTDDGALIYKISIHLNYDFCELNSGTTILHEQNPQEWLEAIDIIFENMIKKIPDCKKMLKEICITGTSGTIIPVGIYGEFLYPAIMYDDQRSKEEAELINKCIQDNNYDHPLKFTYFFSLPKILWIKRHEDLVYQKTKTFCHVPDFIIGYLTGSFEISDYSSALKTGYHLKNKAWPSFFESDLGLKLNKFPVIQPLGQLVASLSQSAIDRYGFERPVAVITGCTDSTAKTLAAGLKDIGEVMISFGTTLVIRIISKEERSNVESVYSHYHPNGLWITGATSNVGTQWMVDKFDSKDENLEKMNQDATDEFPTGKFVYPLMSKGERFPIKNSEFFGFVEGDFKSGSQKYAAYLEGMCYIAKLGLETLVGEDYYDKISRTVVIGQCVHSDVWLQLISTILGIQIEIPSYPEPAYGAALLAAASGTYNQDSNIAINNWIKIAKRFEPEEELNQKYNQLFLEFKELVKKYN